MTESVMFLPLLVMKSLYVDCNSMKVKKKIRPLSSQRSALYVLIFLCSQSKGRDKYI